MPYPNILRLNNTMAIKSSCDERLSTNQKHYTDLSTVSHTSGFINTQQHTSHNPFHTAISSREKQKTNHNIVPSFHPDDFLFDSCYTKKYYAEDSRLQDLKSDDVMSAKDDSIGIEEDFSSSYRSNDSKITTNTDVESLRNDPANFDSSFTQYNSMSIDNDVKSTRHYSSGIEADMNTSYSERNITTANAEIIRNNSAGSESLYNISYAEYNARNAINNNNEMIQNDSKGTDGNLGVSYTNYNTEILSKDDAESTKITQTGHLTNDEDKNYINKDLNTSVSTNNDDVSQNTDSGDTTNNNGCQSSDKDINQVVDGAPIKTEVPEDNLEDMITILVPQDIDMKNIKLEPEDAGYEKISFLDDDDIHEIDDNEDFYIIQVQDPINPDLPKDCRRPRRSINRIVPNANQQLSKCDLCEYQTYDKSNLRKHKLIHTDLKPYSCNLCSFTCKLPKYLKQHMITHMTVRLFPCTVCCHRCRNLTELNRHVKRHLKLNKKSSVEELSEKERTYCVCRDGCKTGGGFNKKIRRDRRDN